MRVSTLPVVPSMSLRNAVAAVSGLFVAVMLGLAAGAVWMVATLYVGRPLPWLAVPVGVLLALTIRRWVRPAGTGAAVLASCATVVAALYVNLLIAGVLIAGSMGLGLIQALKTAGFGMLWQLTRLALSPADIGWTIPALLLAAWLAWHPPRKH